MHGELAKDLRPAWAEIELEALEFNLSALRSRVGKAQVLAVLKADAYGHGAAPVALRLAALGVDCIGVALAEEGAQLRRAGLEGPILVLGPAQSGQLSLYRRYRLTPTLSSAGQIRMWSEWSDAERYSQPVHLKVDTGMSRLGVPYETFRRALREIRQAPHLELQGVLSHFAEAETPESHKNDLQEAAFVGALEKLLQPEDGEPLVHIANSAAALHRPSSHRSLVRLGLALFGYDPANRPESEEIKLQPVMTVRTQVIQIRECAVGTQVGYGGTWRAERASRLGVVPVGYADGYSKRLSNRAEALVAGRRAPIVGAVSMDMSVLDLTDTRGAEGDEVVLLGKMGAHCIDAHQLAAWSETIPYETLCLLGLRLPRAYLRGGEVVRRESRFSL